jgi:hypothetical protein
METGAIISLNKWKYKSMKFLYLQRLFVCINLKTYRMAIELTV